MRKGVAWLGAGFVAVPATILLHEGVHFLLAVLCGFRSVQMHGFAVEYTRGDYPPSHRLMVTGAGYLVTALITLVAGYLAMRRPTALLLALCLAAPLRALFWVPIAIAVARGLAVVDGGDEVTLARLTGWPLPLFVGFSFGLFVFGVGSLGVSWAKLERGSRGWQIGGLLVGMSLGWIAYTAFGGL